MALRVAPLSASKIGWGLSASPNRLPLRSVGIVAAIGLALILNGTVESLSGNQATGVACLALLVFGLPHGSLDIALLRNQSKLNGWQVLTAVLAYLGCAALVYVVWHETPVLALAAFLGIACIHFAEDWAAAQPPFFALATAAAVLTLPALLHQKMMGEIFVRLTGNATASVLADFAEMAAPVALVAAIVGVVVAWRGRRTTEAIETATILLGMIFLPPIIGFAAFFCLSHSPRHFAAAKSSFRGDRRHLNFEALTLTVAGLGIAALIYASARQGLPDDKMIVASFITLSILTVPHILVPRLFARQRLRSIEGDMTSERPLYQTAQNSQGKI